MEDDMDANPNMSDIVEQDPEEDINDTADPSSEPKEELGDSENAGEDHVSIKIVDDTQTDHDNAGVDHVSTEIVDDTQTDDDAVNNSTMIPSELILISRVPQHVREEDERAHTPRIVSIGPFHYKKPGLEYMEALKLKYRDRMMEKHKNKDLWSSLFGAMKELEAPTRRCYSEDFNTINSNDFVMMMLLDGCFIIELFQLSAEIAKGKQVDDDDPIFNTQRITPDLRLDLLMLENQLLLFVLQEIFRQTDYSGGNESCLNMLALQFFRSVWPSNDKDPIGIIKSTIERSYHHLLALFHFGFTWGNCNSKTTSNTRSQTQKKQSPKSTSKRRSRTRTRSKQSPKSTLVPAMKGWVRNAEKLNQAGIFLKKKSGNVLLDIQLERSRLTIPTLLIGVRNKLALRNLLAYEQSNFYVAPYFTSLVMLFYSLVDTPEDVQLLQRKGILGGAGSGSDEQVVALFSSLSKDIVLDEDHCLIAEQLQGINRYCQTPGANFCMLISRIFLNGARFTLRNVIGSVLIYFAVHYFTP
ncbi:hypothetical protein COLO4_24083 [Corchorus olitorius]|uniref:Uncharacterized protein n=1 Tax=Corchorus olitorius TaxID=93759 RepID=A0A1R3ID64_9ROSI|nr:hypothetical protein COLO4_24083 [Corchorus olitorius]